MFSVNCDLHVERLIYQIETTDFRHLYLVLFLVLRSRDLIRKSLPSPQLTGILTILYSFY